MFAFINSRKDHIVSSNLKMLSTHFSSTIREKTFSKEDLISFKNTNEEYLEKLKYLCKNGKPKQVKYAINVIYNNFEKTEHENILHELYKELFSEANLKSSKTFITSLIGKFYYVIFNFLSFRKDR